LLSSGVAIAWEYKDLDVCIVKTTELWETYEPIGDEVDLELCNDLADGLKALKRWQETYANWQAAYANWQAAYAKWQETYANWQETYANWQAAYIDALKGLVDLQRELKNK
jgi:hypothetical protein